MSQNNQQTRSQSQVKNYRSKSNQASCQQRQTQTKSQQSICNIQSKTQSQHHNDNENIHHLQQQIFGNPKNSQKIKSSQQKYKKTKIIQTEDIQNTIQQRKPFCCIKQSTKNIILLILVSSLLATSIFFGLQFAAKRGVFSQDMKSPNNLRQQKNVAATVNPSQSSKTQCNDDFNYFDETKFVDILAFQQMVKQSIISFEKIIPKQQKIQNVKVLLSFTVWDGVPIGEDTIIRTRTINGGKQKVHFTLAYRKAGGQYWSFSQEVIFPCSQTRQFRLSINKPQPGGNIRIYLVGYN